MQSKVQRCAVHRLIVAERRADQLTSKVSKDMAQAAFLSESMWEKRSVELSAAWQEAWLRGATWRQELMVGAARLDRETLARLETAVRNGAARRRKNAREFWPANILNPSD